MSAFFFPLIQEANELQDKHIRAIYDNRCIEIVPIILYCLCDLKARCKVQNFKQFNGYYGCPLCLQEGETLGNSTTVRFLKSKAAIDLRNHKRTVLAAKRAEQLNSCIDGVFGKSCLMALKNFDMIYGCGLDYMHNICLRVVPTWLNLILHAKMKDEYYIKKENRIILNERLLNIQTTSDISYKPRTLDDRSFFRAVEYRNFLLYYSRYVLSSILPKKYVDHLELLSAALYKLLKKEQRVEEINEASDMLISFADKFEEYFRKESVTMNVHLLRHVGTVVIESGPLWATSLFGTESYNGVITSYITARTNIIDQIAYRYITSRNVFEPTISNENKSLLGSKLLVPHQEIDEILKIHGITTESGEIKIAEAIKIDKRMYTSKIYGLSDSPDYFFKFSDGLIGAAAFYIEFESNIFVLVELYEERDQKHHLLEIIETTDRKIYSIDSIAEKLLYFNICDHHIITSIPNKYERM